jgi:hypothetical protein
MFAREVVCWWRVVTDEGRTKIVGGCDFEGRKKK